MKWVLGFLALVALSASALAEPILWLSADHYPGELYGCSSDVSGPFSTIPVYLFAHDWPTGEIESIAAVEFRLDHLPGIAQGMLVTHSWHTPLVDGDPAVGVALAFDPPLAMGVHAPLGRIDLFVVSISLIGEDWCFGVAPSLVSGELRLMDGDGVLHDCAGYGFVLNCVDAPCGCGPYVATTAAESASWGEVKQLY